MASSVGKSLKYYFLRLLRIILDVSTNVFFGMIYGQPKKIPPIKSRILLKPGVELASLIRKKQLKSVDVVTAYISRIKEIQPLINAMVDERYEDALKEAKAVDDFIQSGAKSEEQIAKDTPFLGVPFTFKEAIGCKGMNFSVGVVSRKGVKADADADVIQLMRAAGAIPLVCTNVCEFCMWWNSTNNVYGITRNPYDTRRGPGGSSGGEGALLGAAGSTIGLGSDIGGSIRIPASFNGIFGHKPSRGIISCLGQFPLSPEFKDYGTTGPMCRYASDLLPMVKILATNSQNLKLNSPVDLRNLKIYYMEDEGGHPFVTNVSPEIKKAMKLALNHFEKEYDIQPQKVNFEAMKHSFCIWFTMMCSAGAPSLAEEMADRKGKVNLKWESLKFCFRCCDHTSPALFMAILDGYAPSPKTKEGAKMLERFRTLKKQFEEIFQDNCVFFFPTQPEPAPFLNQTIPKLYNIGYTGIFNMLGYPSTHAHIGFCKGLPIGIQIVGKMYDDHLTIAVAEELEKAFGGWVSPTVAQEKDIFCAKELSTDEN